MPAVLLSAILLALGQQAMPDAPLPDGLGRVIFYRTGGMYFSGRDCPLFEAKQAGTKLADLGGGEYVVMDLAPSSYAFSSARSGRRAVAMTVAAGETRYVRCQISGFPGSPRLEPSEAVEFTRLRSALKPAD